MRAPRILQPGEGETVKLGPPPSAQFAITVDPQRDGTAFAMGTLTVPPGGGLPALRQLERELVLVVQKGQGRATVGQLSKTVLPGMAITVPRGVWHDLRNTGTGLFQCVWVSAPAGLEAYVRELAQAGTAGAPGAQDIAQRYGVELREAGSVAPGATAPGAALVGAPPAGRGRRSGRRRRGGKGRRRASTAAQQAPAPTPAAPAPAARPSAPAPSPAPSAGAKLPPRKSEPAEGPRPRRGRRYGRVKEVYMEGRWVQLSGEGPVIST